MVALVLLPRFLSDLCGREGVKVFGKGSNDFLSDLCGREEKVN